MAGKREDYLTWEEFFMGTALLASKRSKDPHNQIGACIVDEVDNRVLSVGYNGLPRGMSDDEFDWDSTGENTGVLENIKDYYVVHAERNAILNYRGHMKDLQGKTLYVTWFPCTECTKEIIQVGINKIIYLRMYSKKELINISKIMLKAAGVKVVEYNPNRIITREEMEEATDIIQQKVKKFSSPNS